MWCLRKSTGLGVHQQALTFSGDLGPGIASFKEKKLFKFNSNKKGRPYYQYSGAAPGTQLQEVLLGLAASGNSPLLTPREACFHRSPELAQFPSLQMTFPARLLSATPYFACPWLWLTLALIPDLTTLAPHSSLT